MSRDEFKLYLSYLDPEFIRGLYLWSKIRRCHRHVVEFEKGNFPLLAGFRDIVLGHRGSRRGGANPYHVKKLERLLKSYRIDSDGLVIEIGCHKGAILDRLRQKGFTRLLGVDYGGYTGEIGDFITSKAGVKIDNRGFERAEFANANLIFSFDTFEHLKDWRCCLKRVVGSLAHGGIAYINYNPYWAINGAHTAGTVNVPWGHVFLTETEHFGLIRETTPGKADQFIRFVQEFLNKVSLASVCTQLAGLDVPFACVSKTSEGDRLILGWLYKGLEIPPVFEELFIREVEIFIHKP